MTPGQAALRLLKLADAFGRPYTPASLPGSSEMMSGAAPQMPQADAVSIPGQSIHCTTCWAKLKRTDAVCPGCGKRIVTTVEQSDEPHTEGASPAESQLKPDEEASEGPSLASAVGESTRQEINKYTAVGFVDPGPYGLLKLARRRPYNPILHLRLAQKLRKAKKT